MPHPSTLALPRLALVLLLAGSACDVSTDEGSRTTSWSPAPAAEGGSGSDGDPGGEGDEGGGDDTGGQDTGETCLSTDSLAYSTCISDAQCDPGSACTTVTGFGGSYCAPACDPGGDGSECDPDGSLGFDTYCTDAARCARGCGEPDTCPEGLDCQEVEDLDGAQVCAGEAAGQAGYYGICSHPQADGIDCPEDSFCFGGEFLGIEEGICLPTCYDGTCEAAPDESEAVFGYCIDDYLEEPSCVLLCYDGSSTCPTGQECVTLGGSLGLCAPEGTQVPEDLF